MNLSTKLIVAGSLVAPEAFCSMAQRRAAMPEEDEESVIDSVLGRVSRSCPISSPI